MNKLLKRVLLACVFLFTLGEQARADSLADAEHAYAAGDYAKAIELFRPLAEQGNASAQGSLGLMYGLGQGVQKDYVEAEKWFRLAVEQSRASRQRARPQHDIQLTHF